MKNVRDDRAGKAGVSGPGQFKALAVTAFLRLPHTPSIVRGFFAEPTLSHITNLARVNVPRRQRECVVWWPQ